MFKINIQVALSNLILDAHSHLHTNLITILVQKGKFPFYQGLQSCAKALMVLREEVLPASRPLGSQKVPTIWPSFKPKDSGCFRSVSTADETKSV